MEDDLRSSLPAVYQHLLTHVRPERITNNDPKLRREWWRFRRANSDLRPALQGLHRYIATVETAKHRVFQFLDAEILPDNMLVVIALDDAFHLGVLSSSVHVMFALASGGTLEDRPRYNKTRCFDPFPFPDCPEDLKSSIRAIAEELDAHRKRVQAQHPTLTLTGMYNVLEALREGRPLTAKEQTIHDAGLVSILRQLHDDLDAAVFAAYGWSDLCGFAAFLPNPATLIPNPAASAAASTTPPAPAAQASTRAESQRAWEQELLTRLVALNAQRAAEEATGHIRYLRPEYQRRKDSGFRSQEAQSPLNLNPDQTNLQLPAQLATSNKQPATASKRKQPWPKSLAARVRLIDETLRTTPGPHTPESLAKSFARADKDAIAEILETLAALGRAAKSGEQYTSVG